MKKNFFYFCCLFIGLTQTVSFAAVAKKESYKRPVLLIEEQKKQIQAYYKRIESTKENLLSLKNQKEEISNKIAAEKKALRGQLIELNSMFSEDDAFQFTAFFDLQRIFEKSYFIEKKSENSMNSLKEFRSNLAQAEVLEQSMAEENQILEQYVQELAENLDMLKVSEIVERSIFPKTISAIAFFERNKGKLPEPIHGILKTNFGKNMDSETGLLTFQKGVRFEVEKDKEVFSVFDGEVRFAGTLKSLGKVIIVEHPGQYVSLYGNMDELFAGQGLKVKQGQVLGRIAQNTFYFEIRNKNIAVDPLQWLSQYAKK